MGITDSHGRRLSNLWLVPLGLVSVIGVFFFALAGLTGMAIVTSLLDGFPAWYAGPDPAGIDQAFVRSVVWFDHWLVGLVGLSSPWLVFVPGVLASFALLRLQSDGDF